MSGEFKHTFTSGRMNKDLDDRLVPNGEYIDALNIQVASSEGSDAGAIENLLGNEQISELELSNAKTIGSLADTANDKIYWFVTSDELDGIYEFDEKTKAILPILIDEKRTAVDEIKGTTIEASAEGELVLENRSGYRNAIGQEVNKNVGQETLVLKNIDISVSSKNINISIPKGTIALIESENKITFKNIEYSDIEYGGIDIKVTYSSEDAFLSFSKNNPITGVNIIDGLLFWTDNLNPPRRLDIAAFRNYDSNGGQTLVTYKEKGPDGAIIKKQRAVIEEDISVAKKAPLNAPEMVVFDSLAGENTSYLTGNGSTFDLNQYDSGQEFTLSINTPTGWKVGNVVLASATDEEASFELSILEINGNNVKFRLLNKTGEGLERTLDNLNFSLVENDSIYELSFVRFAYRWKYKNGEYSVFSPFTKPAFYPFLDFWRYDGKEAYNYGMINQAKRIVLSNFDKGGDSVEEIDIIFKETRDNNIYTLQTKKKLDFPSEFTIEKEQIHSVIENNQLLRQWDNVPKRAKSLEVTANRVIYGNYVQNYDMHNEPSFDVSIQENENNYNHSLKSNRTYQIGVVYSDEYNRQSPVFSNDTGVKKINKSYAKSQTAFSVAMTSNPPAWATHYRYFVKEPSAEYYNLAADRFYEDEENGFMYISFPSSERNKVTEEHYLLLKNKHGENTFVESENNRYKIIDISAEPPQFITNRTRAVQSMGDVVFTSDYSGPSGGNTITNKDDAENSAPITDFASIQLKQVNGSDEGVPLDITKEIRPGRFISFEYLGKESDKYEIKTLSQHPTGDNEIKIDFVEPFKEDVEIIYQKADGNIGDNTTNYGVSITIHEEYSAAGDEEFDGRFFVKLKTNATLADSIVKQTVGGVEYLAKESVPLIGVFSKNEPKGTGRRGENSWKNINRIKDKATNNPVNKFVVSDGGTAVPGTTPETGKRVKKGSLEYNITLESATENVHHEVDSLLKIAKIGNFVRFVNPDQTPHHDTVYEIGAVATDSYETGYGSSGLGAARGTIKRIHFRFIDEDGNFKPLDKDVVARGDDTWGSEPQMEILQERNNEQTIIKDPAIFETEPLKSKTDLNIYYEASNAFPIAEHSNPKLLDWYNVISFGNGVESNRIRDDFNGVFIDNGVKASTVLKEPFTEEHKFNGLIWSGLLNSRSGVNKTNEFNMANPITKDLLPSYGSIQKLHAWDDSMVILCEDKTLRVLANKSALYNADGSSNLVSDARVIGDPIEYTGEFGIGLYPESFAAFGFRCYFVDKVRGMVFRLSKDGLTPISKNNMSDFFRDRLASASNVIGTYDSRKKLYNVTIDSLDTVSFSEAVNGWVTRNSFIPEAGVYLNSVYYTYKNAELWEQNSNNVDRNNFYGDQYNSFVEFIINEQPSVIKKFKTLGYEGTSGWVAKTIKTDQVQGTETTFKDKENKYFANLTQEAKSIKNLDQKNFSTQGIGRSIRKNNENDYTDTIGQQQFDRFNVKIVDGTSWYSTIKTNVQINTDGSINTVKITLSANNGYIIKSSYFTSSSDLITFENDGDNVTVTIDGDYLEAQDPSNGDTVYINISGQTVLRPRSISGTYSIVGNNITDNIGNGTYSVQGLPDQKVIINRRTIFPDTQWELETSSVTINNKLIQITKTKLPNGSIYVEESIIIPNVTTTNVDYEIKVEAIAIPIPPPKLLSYVDQSDNVIENAGEEFSITVQGEEGAEGVLTLIDSSDAVIQTDEMKFDSSGLYTAGYSFAASNLAETYTFTFTAKEGTVFDDDFPVKSFDKERKARTRQSVVFNVLVGDHITDANTPSSVSLEGFSEDFGETDFSMSITLNGTGYSFAKDTISFSDVSYASNLTNTNIVFTEYSITTAANDALVIKGKIKTENFSANELFTLNLNPLIDKNVTVTFTFSKTQADSTVTANYTFAGYDSATIPYTITAPKNKVYNPSGSEIYRWTLTAASNYQIQDNFTNIEPFLIYDSSNNDETDTFSSTGKVDISRNGAGIMNIGFLLKQFVMPSSDQTYTIRPVESVAEAEPSVPIDAQIRYLTKVNANGFTLYNGKVSRKWVAGGSSAGADQPILRLHRAAELKGIQSKGSVFGGTAGSDQTKSTNNDGWNVQLGYNEVSATDYHSSYNVGYYKIYDGRDQDRLIQTVLTIPDDVYYWWNSDTSSTSKYDITSLGSYLSKATSGSYTELFSENSVTVTSPFEVSNNGKTLTINIIANFNGLSDTYPKYFFPKLTLTVDNTYDNFFYEHLIKEPNKVLNNPCDVVLDKNVDFTTFYSPDEVLKDGSRLYKRDNDGNLTPPLLYGAPPGMYEQNNPDLLAVNKLNNYRYDIIQSIYAAKFSSSNCNIYDEYPIITTEGTKITWTGVGRGTGAEYWGHILSIKNKTLKNRQVKIRGNYYQLGYLEAYTHANQGNGTLPPSNTYNPILSNVTTPEYPKGVPGVIAIERGWDIKGAEIIDKVNNIWEATVFLDSNGEGNIEFLFRVYSNMSLVNIGFTSDQIIDKNGNALGSANFENGLGSVYIGWHVARTPFPQIQYDYASRAYKIGSYRNGETPELSTFPSLYSDGGIGASPDTISIDTQYYPSGSRNPAGENGTRYEDKPLIYPKLYHDE